MNIVEGKVKPEVWVLIAGKNKKSKKHYIGQIISTDKLKEEAKIKFLKKNRNVRGTNLSLLGLNQKEVW